VNAEAQIYVEVRLFKWDPATDPPLTGPTDFATVDRTPSQRVHSSSATQKMTVPFVNFANAATIYDRAAQVLTDAFQAGVCEATERVKPGPKRRYSEAPMPPSGEHAFINENENDRGVEH
jgi:hypothetical protein